MARYQLRPYDDLSAMAVLSALDPADQHEVDLVRGRATGHLALFAEWRGVEVARVISHVALTRGGTPFAVLGLMNTGQAGVAAAALLARDHCRHARVLAALAVDIRHILPEWCRDRGIFRVEARSWSHHPTAARLLRAIGFCEECEMPGFGPAGQICFTQFALIIPACPASVVPEEQFDVFFSRP